MPCILKTGSDIKPLRGASHVPDGSKKKKKEQADLSSSTATRKVGRLTFLNSDAHLRMVVEMGGGSAACGARTNEI